MHLAFPSQYPKLADPIAARNEINTEQVVACGVSQTRQNLVRHLFASGAQPFQRAFCFPISAVMLSIKLDLQEASACENELDVAGLSGKKFLGLKKEGADLIRVISRYAERMEKLSNWAFLIN
jgi:hypothetical protein